MRKLYLFAILFTYCTVVHPQDEYCKEKCEEQFDNVEEGLWEGEDEILDYARCLCYFKDGREQRITVERIKKGFENMSTGKAYFYKRDKRAKVPTYATKQSAGCDLYIIGDYEIAPYSCQLIPTGIVAFPPQGYHFEIALRSSTAIKFPGVMLANGIGVIDSDYCGIDDEIKIAIINTSNRKYNFKDGQRIAQMLLRENLRPAEMTELKKGQLFRDKSRGGFGSTGE